ncbi:MAG: sodium transporter, partial [Bacteroidota bacterium]
YLERRFASSTRILLSVVFQISRAFATSVMIYTVALILTSVMDIPMWQTILIIGIVTLVYSYQGGMKAVVYGDMIQMIILMIGIVICMVAGLHYLGGWDVFAERLDPARLQAVNFSSMGFSKGDEFGFWPMLIGGFFLYVSYYGTDQSQVQRLFSAQDMGTVRKTLLANGLIRFPITFFYSLMGLVIGVFAMSNADFMAQIPVDKPDRMIPVFIKDYLPHGVIGVLIVAILSAAMSSLSSAINSLSAATVEDFFNRDQKLPADTYMRNSKIAALAWGIVCIILAFFTGDIADTVIEAINKIGSVFFGPILATFIAAIAIRRIHALGANIGLLTGVAFNIYLWLGVPEIFWFWWNAFGAAVALGVAYLSSLLIPYERSDKVQVLDFSRGLEMDRPKVI